MVISYYVSLFKGVLNCLFSDIIKKVPIAITTSLNDRSQKYLGGLFLGYKKLGRIIRN